MTYQNARAVVSGGLFALLWSAAASAALPCGTLDEHEKWGGHAVARHVGKTREFLKSRLDDDVTAFPARMP